MIQILRKHGMQHARHWQSKPKSVLAASHLLNLEARRADWEAALPALDVVSKSQKNQKINLLLQNKSKTFSRQRCAS